MATEEGLNAEIGITLGKLQKQLAAAEARMVKATKKIEESGGRATRSIERGFTRAGRTTSNFAASGGLRNVSMQLSQVAQQGAVTGNYMQALAFQLPDLALGFGSVGIAIGALGAMLGPAAIEMLQTADASKELKKTLDALEASVKRVQSAQGRLTSGKLTEQYGSMRGEAQQLLEVERQIASLRAQQSLRTASRGVAEGFGLGGAFALNPQDVADYVQAVQALREERDRLDSSVGQMSDAEFAAANKRVSEIKEQMKTLRAVSSGMTDLQDMLGITGEEAREVAVRFAEIGEADGPQKQAEAMIALVDYISQASGNLSEASEEGKTLYDQLLNAAFSALDLAAVDIATGIGKGADEAERLAQNLALAKQGQILLNAARNNPDFYDPRGEAKNSGSRDPNAYSVPLGLPPVSMPPNPRTKTKRSGSGASKEAKLNKALAATYDKIAEAGGRYAAELARIIDLHEAGAISEEDFKDAVKTLSGEIDAAARAARQLESVFADTFTSILSGAESVSDALSNLLGRLGDMALNAAFSGLFDGALGGLGFLFGGKRASGGAARGGVPYLVNENTPNSEVFVPSQNGAVLNVAQAQRALSGMGGGGGAGVMMTYAPVIDARGADQAAVARLEAAMVQQSRDFEARVQQTLRQGNNRRVNRAWSN